MRIIMIGCEYTGKTTLGARFCKWMEESMGRGQFGAYGWHDHFVMPYLTHLGPDAAENEKKAAQIESLMPSLVQMISIHSTEYHFQFFNDDHNLAIDWYYGDAVYAPVYYGYGGAGLEGHDTRSLARHGDSKVMKVAPDTVLVLLTASSEAIRQRMSDNPHHRGILKDKDVEHVVQRFEEEYNNSLIRRRFTLDTTGLTVETALQEFLRLMEPHFSEKDRVAILTHAGAMTNPARNA